MLAEIMENPYGQLAVSIVLGLGLAALFRRACNGDNCIIVKSPDIEQINKYFYKIDEDCYKYKAYATTCNKDADKK